jgi:glycerol-3-phosphate acyltransferase PlsY
MNSPQWIAVAGFVPGAYLIGSVSFAAIVARAKGVDLRRVGSGNVGATNVARTLGKKWGCVVFLLDMLKGLAPTALAGALIVRDAPPTAAQQAAWLSVALAVIAGHVFSLFLGFRGGKGVATALGVVLGIYPYFTWAGLAAFGVWVAALLISRYVSLASIAAALAFAPLLAAFNLGRLARLWLLMIFAAAVIALILVRHRANIRRLRAGTENRFF